MTDLAELEPLRPATAHTSAGARRAIGPWGTAARIVVGLGLLASVVMGHAVGGWRPVSWLLAVVVFPAVVLGLHWLRARRGGARLDATGPVGHGVNLAVFLALYLTPWYAPTLGATSDAALIFYGASMLLAAAWGYAGCEVLAVSNWVLRRDDQVGCAVFAPVDQLEATATHPPVTADESM
jgi:hypothetical protein